jgi:DNA-binding NarL/FixJ family response regulator
MAGESGSSFELDARARHADADYAGALAAYEAAFTAYKAEQDWISAARAARTIGWLHGWVLGEWAVRDGWFAKGRSLLDRAEGGATEGWLRLDEARRGSDPEEQREQYLGVIELARATDDADLECDATASLGMMLVFSGSVDEGMGHLDHALASICGGEVSELPVVEGCLCGLLFACERTQDVARAEQWLSAADGVMRRGNMSAVAGHCRAHYAGILLAAGRWSDAEAEVDRALDLLSEGTAVRDAALCRLADLRLRQGRPEDAAVLLDGLDHLDEAILPVASLHLTNGRPDVALEILDRALAGDDLPDFVEAPLLARAIDCHLALGELDAARQRSDRLTAAARDQSSRVIQALAAVARGRLCVASGEGDARACWHQAMTLYASVRMPVEVAAVRLELARVLATTRPEVAIAEATAALNAFDAAGARAAADEAAEVLRSLGGPARTGPKRSAELTKREHEVLDLLGHGLTNAEIGQRLFISSKTVEHHVGRVLAKLGLRSRSEAAAYVTRSAISGRS